MIRKISLFSTVALSLISLSPASYAQTANSDTQTNWTVHLGIAPAYAPAFVGSKDYYLYAIPDVSIKYKNTFFLSYVDGLGYNFINANGWRAGPVANLAYERDADGSSIFRIAGSKTKALQGLGNVDTTLEIGGFAEYIAHPVLAKMELRQGINGHRGLIGEAKLNYFDKVGDITYSVGPRLRFGDANYNNTYWGISVKQSANSGLGQYSPDAALISYGLAGSAVMPVSDAVSFTAFAAYDRLSSRIAKSPLISQRGSKNQYLLGVSLAYEFDHNKA